MATQTSSVAGGDFRYAADIVRLLWPSPWTDAVLLGGRGADVEGGRRWYVFPSSRRPRILVPTDLPAAARMVQRLGKGETRSARLARRAAVLAVSSRHFRLLGWPVLAVSDREAGSAPDSVEHYLAASVGCDVRVGVLLGTRRANQKPVLQVFGADGGVVGYAKIGHNDLTAELVRSEAAALRRLAAHRPRTFRAPRLLHHGRWHGLEVLVMSALPGQAAGAVPTAHRTAAMRELARLVGTARRPLADSTYWADLRARSNQIADGSSRERLRSAQTAVAAQWGETEIEFGCWHGDWGDWNMAVSSGTLQVWDWERFDCDVPVGFDLLHHQAQRFRPQEATSLDRAPYVWEQASDALLALGVPRTAVTPTVAAYLLEMGVRYAIANHCAGTAALRRRARWVEAQLDHLLGEEPTSSERGRQHHEPA